MKRRLRRLLRERDLVGQALAVSVVRIVEETARRVLVQVYGLVLYRDTVVNVTHLIAYGLLVCRVTPLVVDNKLELIRAGNQIEAHYKVGTTPSQRNALTPVIERPCDMHSRTTLTPLQHCWDKLLLSRLVVWIMQLSVAGA